MEKKERKQSAFIYIIQCCDANGYVKIGVTTDNTVLRAATLQVGCPYELKVMASFHVNGNLKTIEMIIHKQLERFLFRGEWFKIKATQAIQFISASLHLLDTDFEEHQQQDDSSKITLELFEFCKQSRKTLGISQATLADKANISLSKLKRFELGKAIFEDEDLKRLQVVLLTENTVKGELCKIS